MLSAGSLSPRAGLEDAALFHQARPLPAQRQLLLRPAPTGPQGSQIEAVRSHLRGQQQPQRQQQQQERFLPSEAQPSKMRIEMRDQKADQNERKEGQKEEMQIKI